MKRIYQIAKAPALLAAGAVTLAGCAVSDSSSGGDGGSHAVTMPASCGRNGAVVLAVEGHANAPQALVTATMRRAIQDAANSRGAVGIVGVDGSPELIRAGAFEASAGNAAANKANEATFVDGVSGVVSTIRAKSAHVDALDALRVSADAVTAACPSGGTVFLEDSGLSDTGAMDFTSSDLLQASPAEVTEFLERNKALPHLHGVNVVLVGLGDTMPPQEPLDQASRDNLVAIWKSLVTAAGAKTVEVDPAPVQTDPSAKPRAGLPRVLTTRVPASPDFRGVVGKLKETREPTTTTITLPDAGPIGFLSDRAVLRDPAAANAELDDLAGALRGLPTAKITILGTTSSAGDDTPAGDLGREILSQQRAEVVRAALIERGVSASCFEPIRGYGYHFNGYVPDRDKDGNLLPGAAAQNRSVRITIRSSGIS